MINIVILSLICGIRGECSICSLSGSKWTYDSTSGLSCPYSSMCTSACYGCQAGKNINNCLGSRESSSCPNNTKICTDTYYNKSTGKIALSVPLEVLCYWQIDLRNHNVITDYVEISFSDTAFKSNILVISFNIPRYAIVRNNNDFPGSIYSLNSNYIKVQGNYIVIAYWQNTDAFSHFSASWKSENDSSGEPSSQLFIILGVFLPSACLCCCILCLYSIYRKKSMNGIAPNIEYQIMNRNDEFNESFYESAMPIRYYLKLDDSTCSICFDNFSIGDELRITPCSHTFHSRCMDEWIDSKPAQLVCPLCKNNLFSRDN